MQRLLATYYGGTSWVISELLDSEKAMEAFKTSSHKGRTYLTSNFKAQVVVDYAKELYKYRWGKAKNIKQFDAYYIDDYETTSFLKIDKEWFTQTSSKYQYFSIERDKNIGYMHVAFHNISIDEFALLLTSSEKHVREAANEMRKFFK